MGFQGVILRGLEHNGYERNVLSIRKLVGTLDPPMWSAHMQSENEIFVRGCPNSFYHDEDLTDNYHRHSPDSKEARAHRCISDDIAGDPSRQVQCYVLEVQNLQLNNAILSGDMKDIWTDTRGASMQVVSTDAQGQEKTTDVKGMFVTWTIAIAQQGNRVATRKKHNIACAYA